MKRKGWVESWDWEFKMKWRIYTCTIFEISFMMVFRVHISFHNVIHCCSSSICIAYLPNLICIVVLLPVKSQKHHQQQIYSYSHETSEMKKSQCSVVLKGLFLWVKMKKIPGFLKSQQKPGSISLISQ